MRGKSIKAVKAKREAEEAKRAKEAEAKAKKEAEEKAKREAEEAKEKAKREAEEAKEKAKKEAEEARRAKEAEAKAKREAEEAKEKASTELYKGMVKLAIVSPVDYDQVRELEEYLRQVQDLRLVLVRGSVEEGTKIIVSAEKPIPLVSVLREMPPVEQVVKSGKEIQVTLKTKQ